MRASLFLALVASIGCGAYPLAQLPSVATRLEERRSAPTPADVVPCSATTAVEQPAGTPDSKTGPEIPPVLPAPNKVREQSGSDAPETERPAALPALTLENLERLALSNNPTIPQAAALVQQQQGLQRQAGLYPNPVAGYVRTDADKSGESQTDGVFLSQTIITAGKLRLGRAEGAQEVNWRNWELSAQQMRVLNDVRIRYYEALGAQQAVQAEREQVRLAEDALRAAEQLLKAQQVARPDMLQAEMQLSAARTALQDAQYREQLARQQLANVVGLAELPPVSVTGSLEENLPQMDWQNSLQRLLDASPLLKAQEAQIRAAQYELQLARAQAVPDVNVQVVAERDHIMKYSSVTTLVSAPVPLFNRNQGNIVNAQGVLKQAQREYERLRLAVSDQLAVSFRSYLTLRTQTESLRTDILPRAKENLDLLIQVYKERHLDFPRVLAARREFAQASLGYIDAMTELHKILVEIEGLQLTGGLNPTEVGTALQPVGAAATGIRGVILQLLQEQRAATTRNLPGAIQAGER